MCGNPISDAALGADGPYFGHELSNGVIRLPPWLGGGFESSEHDTSIHESELGVTKCSGQSADDAKAELLPKANRWLVGRDDEVELHGAEADSACLIEGVLAHASAHTEPASRRQHHKSRVGDVAAECGLVRLENVSANNTTVALGNVGVGVGAKPVSQCLVARGVRGESVGVAGSNDRVEDFPDGVLISFIGRA
jgi:hypothetical protein